LAFDGQITCTDDGGRGILYLSEIEQAAFFLRFRHDSINMRETKLPVHSDARCFGQTIYLATRIGISAKTLARVAVPF